MVEQGTTFGVVQKQPEQVKSPIKKMSANVISIGVDGCKGGWVAAILNRGELEINKYNNIYDIVNEYPDFDEIFIDMVIGLASSKNHIRPDTYARQLIKERAATIFPAPCRQAVYAKTVAAAYEENERVMGKKFTPLTVGIIPKIREIDSFLQDNLKYRNVMKESHPEVCFAQLNGRTLLTKKSEVEGLEERIHLLAKYIPELSIIKLSALTKSLKCKIDDIVDALCLTVSANIAAQGYFKIIPENPMIDETGLLMQMVIPCLEENN
ncbi:MAG: hydrolase [Anaerocolumna sp.]|nr:hydrolase [Anaerocolumna sp.]